MSVNIPFTTIDWDEIPVSEHPGETSTAWWKTLQYGDLRIRMVEYAPGYKADHWCQKGHIIYCIEGEMITEMEDGREYVLRQGMSYQVADNQSSHRSRTATGAKLFIVDGAFLTSSR
jgi:quercetin dioxygenase-like cupin family protein